MIRLITFFSLIWFILPDSLPAQVQFMGSWDSAISEAEQQDKYLFLDAYTDWCGWCKVMDRNTFSDPEVTTKMKEQFVPLKLEMEKDEMGRALSMKYQVSSFPSFLIFSPEGKLVYRIFGYHPPESFLKELSLAVDPNNHLQMPGISADLHLDYPDFYIKTFSGQKEWPGTEAVDSYFKSQEDLFSEVNWAVMRRFQNSRFINTFFLDHYDRYEKLFGTYEVQTKLNDLLYHRLQNAVEERDESALHEILGVIDHYMEEDVVLTSQYYKIYFYKKMKDWKPYISELQEYVRIAGYENTYYLNSESWFIYENVEEPFALNPAIGWMQNVVTLEPTYAYLDTYAALLYKNGQYTMAKQFAERAIEVGRKAEENVSATEQLLEEIEMALAR